MEVLRRRLEQQEYDAMVANVKPQPKTLPIFSADEAYSSVDAKMTKNQISAIINILFSMVSVFVAIFVWLRNSPDYLVYLHSILLIGSECCGVCFLLLLWVLVRRDCICCIGGIWTRVNLPRGIGVKKSAGCRQGKGP